MLRRLQISQILCALALIVSSSCGGSSEPPNLSPCTGAITPSASGSRFTWTPKCGLSELIVNAPPSNGGPQTMWDLKAASTLLAPGIDYGVAPTGATSTTGPVPPQTGVDYHVVFLAPGLSQSAGDLSWRP
jgi:hypothetical protein